MKNILVYCDETEENQDCQLSLKIIDMLNEWIKIKHLKCISTGKNPSLKENLNKFDKIILIKSTNENNIKEYKFVNLNDNSYILKIKGYEWNKGKISDNAKLNLEQAYQYLVRKLSEWISIRKNLPIEFLTK